MEGKNSKKTNQPRAILVFGVPGSGKTTFAEKFAKKFHAAFFDLGEIASECELDRKVVLMLIKQLAKTGQILVFEGGLDTEKDRIEVRNILREAGYRTNLIWIQTDITTVKQRLKLKLRSLEKAKNLYETKISGMEAPADREHPIVLSGKHTFETQLKHTVSQLAATNDIKRL